MKLELKTKALLLSLIRLCIRFSCQLPWNLIQSMKAVRILKQMGFFSTTIHSLHGTENPHTHVYAKQRVVSELLAQQFQCSGILASCNACRSSNHVINPSIHFSDSCFSEIAPGFFLSYALRSYSFYLSWQQDSLPLRCHQSFIIRSDWV